MPGTNLTMLEANERSKNINVERYEIKLDLSSESPVFYSETRITFQSKPNFNTFIDLIAQKVHSIELNGINLEPETHFSDSRIELPNLKSNNILTIKADVYYTNTGEGMHRFIDPVDNETYLYTQFEAPDARRVFAVFEQPDLKSVFSFTIIAPKKWHVINNSKVKNLTQVEENKTKWEFEDTPLMSSYITAIIAGPYEKFDDKLTNIDGREIQLGLYCRKSLAKYFDTEKIFSETKAGFKFFGEIFNYPYPFDKYDQLFVPEYNMGAMENIGAVTYNEDYIFRSKVTDASKERRTVTILHELSHMWFGNLVTMKWWNDLWLNESFAEYVSTLTTSEITEWKDAWTTFSSLEKSMAYVQDQMPTTHPVVSEINDLEDVLVNFDTITYAKGGSVLKQLVYWVGKDNFFAGISEYFKKHAYKNTTLQDLLNELSIASGKDLSLWSKLWLETAGVNTLSCKIDLAENKETIRELIILQGASDAHPTIRPHKIGVSFYNKNENGIEKISYFEEDIKEEVNKISQAKGLKHPDFIMLNDNDLSYAKIRLDNKSKIFAANNLSYFTDSLTRSVLWSYFWDMTRDAEISVNDFIKIVTKHIFTEKNSTTIRVVLSRAVTACKMYSTDSAKIKNINILADNLWNFTNNAELGSDAQFQFFKNFTLLANTQTHTTNLKRVLNGEITILGLEIDKDLRWDIIIALSSCNEIGVSEIDKEAIKDNTSSGRQKAAKAKTSINTAEVKEQTWNTLISSDISNAICSSMALGLSNSYDENILKTFVDDYFANINKIWSNKSFAIASTIIEEAYPKYLVSKEIINLSNKWLQENINSPWALRRMVIENLDSTKRAYRVRQSDEQLSSIWNN